MNTKEIIKKYKNKSNPESQMWGNILVVIQQIIDDKVNSKENEIYTKIMGFVENELKNEVKDVAVGAKRGIEQLKNEYENKISEYIRNRKIEIKGNDGKDYILTESDKKEIAKSIKIPVLEKEIVIKEQPIIKETKIENKVTGSEIVQKINNGSDKILRSKIEGLDEEINKLRTESRQVARTSSKGGGGGMGNTQHESKSVDSTSTSVKTTYSISANGYALWVYYQGQMVARGVGYTVANDKKTINLLFTPVDGTFIDVIYIR